MQFPFAEEIMVTASSLATMGPGAAGAHLVVSLDGDPPWRPPDLPALDEAAPTSRWSDFPRLPDLLLLPPSASDLSEVLEAGERDSSALAFRTMLMPSLRLPRTMPMPSSRMPPDFPNFPFPSLSLELLNSFAARERDSPHPEDSPARSLLPFSDGGAGFEAPDPSDDPALDRTLLFAALDRARRRRGRAPT